MLKYRSKAHGDFASNLAMMLTKATGMPRALAEKITELVADKPGLWRLKFALF